MLRAILDDKEYEVGVLDSARANKVVNLYKDAADSIYCGDNVLDYYAFVDARNFDQMFGLFSDDVLYRRCDHILNGKKELKRFYLEERKINGYHQINLIVPSGKIVGVEGTFKGRDRQGNPLEIGFADIFHFNDDFKIYERNTCLEDSKLKEILGEEDKFLTFLREKLPRQFVALNSFGGEGVGFLQNCKCFVDEFIYNCGKGTHKKEVCITRVDHLYSDKSRNIKTYSGVGSHIIE